MPEQDIFLIQLSVSEIVNNAIEHGYRGEPSKRVDVTLSCLNHILSIEISDDAPPLPVEHLKKILQADKATFEPDVNWSTRGHGLQIVRQAIDSMDFARSNGRNSIILRKRLPLTAAEAGTS